MRLCRAVVLLTLVGVSAGAQAPTLAPGTPVRVWSPELPRRPWNATLRAADESTLVLRARGRPGRGADSLRSVSRSSVARLEMLVPRTRREGVRYHALFGGTVGIFNGLVFEGLAAAMGAEFTPLELSIPVGVGLGVGLGAITGAIWPGSYWRRISP